MSEQLKIKSINESSVNEVRFKRYENSKSNKNNMSFWLPKVLDCGIKIPETIIMPLSFEQFLWFGSDEYSDDAISCMGEHVVEFLKDNNFNIDRELFIKTGNFSDKFDFSHCKVTDINNIGEQFLSVYYSGMMVGAGSNTELVIREFIKSDILKPTIYNGMPLNTEFRAFYDFDNKEVMGMFNYWDTDVVSENLECTMRFNKKAEADYNNFITASRDIEKEFEEMKDTASDLVSKHMKNVSLDGIWSIDLMYINNEFYLIDMALGHQSYYCDRIAHLVKK